MRSELKREIWGAVIILLFASWVPVVIFINEWLGMLVALTAMYLIYEIE